MQDGQISHRLRLVKAETPKIRPTEEVELDSLPASDDASIRTGLQARYMMRKSDAGEIVELCYTGIALSDLVVSGVLPS